MGRRRITHELISSEYVRRVTFRKRKDGLLKKLSELTVLCGIPACAIIYNADTQEPEVWPNRPDADDLLDRFHKLPKASQTKYMMNQGNFLSQLIKKVKRELEKEKKKNYSIELALIESNKELNGADYSRDLRVAARSLEHKIKATSEKVKAKEAQVERSKGKI